MSVDPKTGIIEVNGWTMYSQRNYLPKDYTHKKALAKAQQKV